MNRASRTRTLAAAAGLLLAAAAAGAPLPNADALLNAALGNLPKTPLALRGELRTRMPDQTRRLSHVLIHLNYGATPAQLRYTIQNAFGAELQQLTLLQSPGEPPRYFYAAGSPLKETPLPSLGATIQDSALTWADATLAFLWWRGGSTTGIDTVRGQECYVLDVPAPDDRGAYASVRIWLDRRFLMPVQAEGRGADGAPVRRLTVNSIKKVGDEWMVKDLEILQLSDGRRTMLAADEIQATPDAP